MLPRLFAVYRTVCRYRLDTLLPNERRPWPLRLLIALCPVRQVDTSQARGRRLREALEALGPVFIKFGQLLSTRRDLLPDDIADELALLQDQVPPFSTAEAVALIEQSLGSSIDTLFLSLNTRHSLRRQLHKSTPPYCLLARALWSKYCDLG